MQTRPNRRRRGQTMTLFDEGYYAEQDGKPRKPPEHYNMQAAREWDRGWCAAADVRSAGRLLRGTNDVHVQR